MSKVGAPRRPVQTSLPSYARQITEATGRKAIQVDARNGPMACITHTELFPHGETISIMCSAMVKSNMQFGNPAFEGISVAVQAFVVDSSQPSGLRRIWQHRPDLEGDSTLWVHDQFSDYTQVNRVVQMPDDITPHYVSVSWITKGFSGQASFSDFTVRDFYARTYSTSAGAAPWQSVIFNEQVAPGLLSDPSGGINRDLNVWAHYLDSHVVSIMSGQPLDVLIEVDIEEVLIVTSQLSRAPLIGYIGLKCTRRKDDGSDWIANVIPRGFDDFVLSGLILSSIRKPALNAYKLIEPVFMVYTPPSTAYTHSGPRFSHNGAIMKITVDDAVESGTA